MSKKDYQKALKDGLMELDSQAGKEESSEMAGTTACVLLVTKDSIYCANVGDSRAVLCTNGKAEPLSYDHKPQNDEELDRIEKSGHFVEDDRVDGNLALSRAIGDF